MALEAFDTVDLIHAKRDGETLSTEQINWLVDAYTRGYVGDEQMAAMAMAIFLNGMSREEIRDLTLAMIASGETMNLGGLSKPTADKHSTGRSSPRSAWPCRSCRVGGWVTRVGRSTRWSRSRGGAPT